MTVIIQWLAYGQTVPQLVLLTLVPITIGVGIATVYDISLNMIGIGKGDCLG